MRRAALCLALVAGCGSTAPAPRAPVCTPLAEANTVTQVQLAEAQPAWVEIQETILTDTSLDFSTLGPEIQAKLVAIGARQIGLEPFISAVGAVVPAGRLPEIQCWTGVVEIDGNGLVCTSSDCVDPCFASAACDGSCAPFVADRIDLAHGCVSRGVTIACAGPFTDQAGSDELTCYTRKDTGDSFAVRNPWLVAAGDTMLRTCTRAEGGRTPPDALPTCP